MTVFYDTHAHLDFPEFEADLPSVIERAREAGLAKIITVGTDRRSSERALELSERFPGVFAAVGWHPSHAHEAPADVRPMLRELGRHPKVVALGETGLDYHRLPSQRPGGTPAEDEVCKRRQLGLFRQHLEAAAELGLNCVVHQRECFDQVLAVMQPFVGRVRGVFHCFADDVGAMQRVLAMGSLVSFTGIVTFKNAQSLRDTVAAAPLGQFMLETDSPYLAPVPYRGKRCEPARVKEIAALVAQVKRCSLAELGRATCEAAEGFFSGLRSGK